MQVSSLQAQDLFHLQFRATCKSLNDRGRLTSTRITETNLIALWIGTNAFATNQGYSLVYNETADSIQVVDATNGSLVGDVFTFQGGNSNSDGRLRERSTFVFVPGQSDSVGSALISEKLRHTVDHVLIHGRMQFTLLSLEPGSFAAGTTSSGSGATNSPTSTNTFGGTNSASGTNASTGTNSVPGGTSTNSSSGSLSGTNGPPVPSVTLTPGTNNASGTSSGSPATPSATATNAVSTYLTNPRICSGAFSGGRRVFVLTNSPGP